MTRRIYNNTILLAGMLILLSACSKYDEGPYFSLYSKDKRVQGRWYFSVVKYNDVDSTDAYRLDPMQSIEFFQNPDKEAIWNAYTWRRNSATDMSMSYGAWKLNEEKDSLTMVTTLTTFGMGESDFNTDTVEYFWKINRLAYTEMWLQRQMDDTTQVNWKLWKLAY